MYLAIDSIKAHDHGLGITSFLIALTAVGSISSIVSAL